MLESNLKFNGFRETIMATSQSSTGYTNTTTRMDVRGMPLIGIWVSGSPTGLSITVRGELIDSSAYQILDVYDYDMNKTTAITATGRYWVNVSGFTKIKMRVDSITGGDVSITCLGEPTNIPLLTTKSLPPDTLSDAAYFSAQGSDVVGDVVDCIGYGTVVLDVTNNSNCDGYMNFKASGRGSVQTIPVFNLTTRKYVLRIKTTGLYRVDMSGFERFLLETTQITTGSFTVGYRVSQAVVADTEGLKLHESDGQFTIYKLSAQVNSQSQALDETKSQVLIKNLSKESPVEVSWDGSTNFTRVEPGESMRLGARNEDQIYYRSIAGIAPIEIMYGNSLDAGAKAGIYQKYRMENTGKAIRCVQGRKMLYTSNNSLTLYYSEDLGETVVNSKLFAATIIQAYIAPDGSILAWDNATCWRSTDDGATYSNAQSGGSNIICWAPHSQNSIDFDGDGYLCFAEYGNDGTHPDTTTNRYIWRSTDNGATWTKVLTKVHETSGSDSNKIRHFHTCRYSIDHDMWIATSGDQSKNVHWFKSTDGITWNDILNVGQSQQYRTLNTAFTRDGNIIWGTDTSEDYMGVFKIPVADLSTSSSGDPKTVTTLADINGEIYVCEIYNNDLIVANKVGQWFNGCAGVYVGKNMGAEWSKIVSWPIEDGGTQGGFSVTPGIDHNGAIYLDVSFDAVGIKELPEYIRQLIIYL